MLLDRKLSKAENFRKVGNIDEAIQIYDEILLKFPENKRAKLGKLSCKRYASDNETKMVIHLFEKQLFSEANSEINNLISMYPNDENLYNISGAINSRLKNFSQAEEQYKNAIKIKPDFPEAYNNLAETLNTAKRHMEAEELCIKAINYNPNYAEAYNNLGNALINLSQYKKALNNYKKSLELNNPNQYSVFNNLCLAYAYIGDLTSSVNYAIQAINLNPNDETSVNSLSNISIYLDRAENDFVENFLMKNFNYFCQKSKMFVLTDNIINNFIKCRFDQSLIYHERLNKELNIFNKRGLSLDEKDLIFVKAYQYFVNLLILFNKNNFKAESKNNNLEKKYVYHIGESHCLSFAHQKIIIDNESFFIKPMITIGLKAWHLTDTNHNKQKRLFLSQLKKIPENSKIFLSIGEIDTRENEGIISFYKKSQKDLKSIIEKTVCGYVNFIENYFQNKNVMRYYFSIAAPYIIKESPDYNAELSNLRIKVIKMFNEQLEKYIKDFGGIYVDTFKFTSNENGESNKKYMIDRTHLSPSSLENIQNIINKN